MDDGLVSILFLLISVRFHEFLYLMPQLFDVICFGSILVVMCLEPEICVNMIEP